MACTSERRCESEFHHFCATVAPVLPEPPARLPSQPRLGTPSLRCEPMWPHALIGSVLGSSAIQTSRVSMHPSKRKWLIGTGGRQFATRIELYVEANEARSDDVVPVIAPPS